MKRHSYQAWLALTFAAVVAGHEYAKTENQKCGACGSQNNLQIGPYDQRWMSIDGSDPECVEALQGTKGSGYKGCQSRTPSGRICQSWTSQSPHRHSRTPSRYPHKGIDDHSFCRNPDGSSTIWCYTTDSRKRYEYCLPRNALACDETVAGVKNSGYRGCQTQTTSGRTCQKWTSQAPHRHSRTPGRYKYHGMGDHNYCRNPDGEPKIWCYTTDPDKRWEQCEPKAMTVNPPVNTTLTTGVLAGASAGNATNDDPVAVCKEACDKSGSCAGFDVTKSGTCYFRRSTICKKQTDADRDCYTKVKGGGTDGPGKSQITTACQTGVCHKQDFIFFGLSASLEKCSDSCFNAKYKGHNCVYFSYSNKTNYCLHYEKCDHVDTQEIQCPADVYLEAADLSTFSTCKFTVYKKESWVDMQGSKAQQPSEGWGGAPSRAIDGNSRADWGGGSCTHTHRHQNPWWELKLKEETPVGAVTLVNRGDCCERRLDNFNVKVDGVVCASGSISTRGGMKEVECGLTGKTLTIESKRHDYLTICEVKIKRFEYVDISNETWFL